ncbi:fibronectin type III domain-containing protein [Parapedobacter sp. 10938]|uniref:fibronectin type III domain-containing protein n=1 Tax=Parapedobacter flavus TaxID=3110225 RepID=UPI002DBE191B|nr:fibronectin type III domain-containing protein [Parapedobacter sp. 10938]MEC3881603.1 fibronectin type III domain-containing protein [Parapedobacter sp. 10938]
MHTPRVYTSYKDASDALVATLAGKTLTDMTGNANYPSPIPTIEDYAVVVADYRTKHEAAAETGGKFANTAKDLAKQALLEQMKRLATYVNFTAAGDANKLVSSGFMLIPPPEARKAPEVPLWVRVLRGPQRGQLLMKIAKVKHVWQYEYQIGTRLNDDDPIVWGDEIFTTTDSRSNVITGLQRVKEYWVRVRGMNGHGVGDWSDAVSGVTE